MPKGRGFQLQKGILMKDLIQYAKNELVLLGYAPLEACDNPIHRRFQKDLMALLETFEEQYDPFMGIPREYFGDVFKDLICFKPLTPLTGGDEEWEEIEPNHFQNKRCHKIFKKNGVPYNIEGYTFWLQRGCEKIGFWSRESQTLISFPYTVTDPELIEVTEYEANRETEKEEVGSGWRKTRFPKFVLRSYEKLDKLINP